MSFDLRLLSLFWFSSELSCGGGLLTNGVTSSCVDDGACPSGWILREHDSEHSVLQAHGCTIPFIRCFGLSRSMDQLERRRALRTEQLQSIATSTHERNSTCESLVVPRTLFYVKEHTAEGASELALDEF